MYSCLQNTTECEAGYVRQMEPHLMLHGNRACVLDNQFRERRSIRSHYIMLTLPKFCLFPKRIENIWIKVKPRQILMFVALLIDQTAFCNLLVYMIELNICRHSTNESKRMNVFG